MAQRTGTVIDVGANIGQTLLKIKSIDPQIDYLGFEPSPACIYYLDVLIRKNRLTNCVVVPLGASDKPSIISFYYNHDSDAAATTIEGFWTGRLAKSNRRVILVDSGDNVIKRLAVQSVGVIKIDVEGGELEAISGFSDIIRAQATPIVVEILPASCDRDATNPDAEAGISLRIQRLNHLDTLLRELQLTPYRLMPDGQLLETHDFDSDHWDPEMSNYLLVPPSSTLDLNRLSAEFKSEMRRLANL